MLAGSFYMMLDKYARLTFILLNNYGLHEQWLYISR
jgi:hypothetical protein